MASQISIGSIHSGQMLWAFCSPHPYWPAIVCALETRNNFRNPSVHVKFCALNRKSCWIRLDKVFEFNGFESFVAKKRLMKSKLSKVEFHKAFDTANNEKWRRAVVEATFIMHKDLESRIVIFDTLNVLDDVNIQLNIIAGNIIFEDANADEPLQITEQPKQRSIRQPLQPKIVSDNVQELQKPSKSKPSNQPNQKGRRRSEPPQIVEQSEQRLTRLSLPPKKVSSKKLSAFAEFEKALLSYGMHSYPNEILFQSTRNGSVCKICCSLDDRNDGYLVKCSACGDHVHKVCSNNNNDESYVNLPEELLDATAQRKRSSIKIRIEMKVFCNECQPSLICFACKEEATAMELKQCNVKSCTRYYHIDCLDEWKQVELVDSKLKCPLHVCHTCSSNRNDHGTLTTKFTFCVKCPTAYHLRSCCIPAGTIILTQRQHICIRHRCESRLTLPSLDWCSRCGEEGDALICCGSCPKTYHMSCLDSLEVPGAFLCDSCVNGKNPLYGEMVITKFGVHHWWPAVIVPTFSIPAYMYDRPPNDHEFCIRFFGDYTFGWIGRSSVLFYSKSDATKFLIDDPQQTNAFHEAATVFDKRDYHTNEAINLETNGTQLSRIPPQYTRISTINFVAPARLSKSKDEPCKCSCTRDEPCGPTSECENRDLCIECDPKQCPNGSYCKNQCFERKVYAAVKVVFMDEKKEFGLIADEFISAGTLVMEYLGELITESEFQRRRNHKKSRNGTQHYYFMTYSKGLYIDAEKKGNASRFVNHSCEPNCETQKWAVNKVDLIGYFALKDIEKGTEITTNYDFDRGDVHQCFCGAKKCRGVIGNRNSKN